MHTVERYADSSRSTDVRMSVYLEHESSNIPICVHVDSAQGQLNYLTLLADSFHRVLFKIEKKKNSGIVPLV